MAHPHAKSMALYAEDAAEVDKPYERWEYSIDGGRSWIRLDISHPMWLIQYKYRRISERPSKPQVKVAGYQFNAPLQELPTDVPLYIANVRGVTKVESYNSKLVNVDNLNVHDEYQSAHQHSLALLALNLNALANSVEVGSVHKYITADGRKARYLYTRNTSHFFCIDCNQYEMVVEYDNALRPLSGDKQLYLTKL